MVLDALLPLILKEWGPIGVGVFLIYRRQNKIIDEVQEMHEEINPDEDAPEFPIADGGQKKTSRQSHLTG